MSSKLNNIFTETSCLSPGILLDYARGKLNNEDRYLVEKHLADCELCSDALDGFALIKSNSKLQKIFISITNLIDIRTKRKGGSVLHFNFRVKLAVAAVFISVFGITVLFKYLFDGQKQDMMAIRMEKNSSAPLEDAKSKEDVGDSIFLQEQDLHNAISGDKEQSKAINDLEFAKQDNSEKDIPLVNINSSVSANGMAAAEQKVVAGYYWSPQKDEDLNKDDNTNYKTIEELNQVIKAPFASDYKSQYGKNMMADSVSISDGAMKTKNLSVLDKYSNKEMSEKALADNQTTLKASKKAETKVDGEIPIASSYSTTATGSTITTTSPVIASGKSTILVDQRYATAINKYDSLDYSGSKVLLESYLSSYPNDYSALYYCAASNYFLKNYYEAIKNFKKVVKKKDFAFYETSLWYLALAYIDNVDSVNAQIVLNKIVAEGGSFKTQAEIKLLEIKK